MAPFQFSATDKIAIFGISGCGKSTLQRLITSCYPRKIVVDRMREHNDGDFVTYSFDHFAHFLSQAISSRREHFKLVLQFDTEAESERQKVLFEQALRLAYKYSEHSGMGVNVTIEEVQNFSSPHYLPHWLEEIALTGRHQGISLAVSSQFPALTHKALISQGHVFVGWMYEKNALEYLRGIMGDIAYEAKNLPPGKFIHFHRGQTRIIDNGFSTAQGS